MGLQPESSLTETRSSNALHNFCDVKVLFEAIAASTRFVPQQNGTMQQSILVLFPPPFKCLEEVSSFFQMNNSISSDE
ncbi:hypothetical protein CDAR_310751 [Caerostris darwini]|uniref:Uncharacterized protein n=1 Tax=Caerostris darwini TaxID=1538125 RepID=A0AAV4VPT1_9ARAC|nr:hypothetical protein CDAR_310751 [Caerostris darwini]